MVYDFKYALLYEKSEFVATLLGLFIPIALLALIFAAIDYFRKHFDNNALKLGFYSLLFLQSSCRVILVSWVYAGHTDDVLYFDLPALLLMGIVSIVILQVDKLFPPNLNAKRRRAVLLICNICICLANFAYYIFSPAIPQRHTLALMSFLGSGATLTLSGVMVACVRSNWISHRFMGETKIAASLLTCIACLIVRAAVSISGIYTDFSPHERPPDLSSSASDEPRDPVMLSPALIYYGVGECAICYICLYIQHLTPYPTLSDEAPTIPLLADMEKAKVKMSEVVANYYEISEPEPVPGSSNSNSDPNSTAILNSSTPRPNTPLSQTPPNLPNSLERQQSDVAKFFKLFEKSLNSTNVVLHEVLGKGGSGAIVYRCTLREGPFSGGTFAVKVMKDCVPADLDALMNEVRIYQSLKHVNIVKFMGADLSSRREVRIFMEYIPHTLDNYIKQRTIYRMQYFTAAQIAKYMLQLTTGLQVLHERNIIHRDLKTSNIFVVLSNQGDISELKIGDFDVSTFLRRDRPAGYFTANKGTEGFRAPEMASNTLGKIKYDAKVDIWSLGMVLYSMMTLQEPYENENRFEMGWDAPPTMPAEVRSITKYAKLILIFEICSAATPADRPVCSEVARLLQDAITSPSL